MYREIIKKIIEYGEGSKTKFKEAKNGIPKSIYETICSFSNRNGGYIILGVNDSGEIIGVNRDSAQNYIKDIITATQNGENFNPTLYIKPDLVSIDDKLVIVLNVPENENVVRMNGKIYDRINDSDINIDKNMNQIKKMYERKSDTSITENLTKLYDYEDLNIETIKKYAKEKRGKTLTNKEEIISLLKDLNLITYNKEQQKYLYKKASILLFGTKKAIDSLNIISTVDCLYFANNERYNDAVKCEDNLFNNYELIMDFIIRHTNNKFSIEGDTRVDYREPLFREIIVNMLVHKNYGDRYRSRVEITNENIKFSNAAYNEIYDNISPDTVKPVVRNETIAKVFRYFNLSEEFGTGIKKIFKFAKLYNNNEPEIKNKDLYEIEYSFIEEEKEIKINNNDDIKEHIVKLIKENKEITKQEIADILKVSSRTISRKIQEIENLEYIQNGKKGYWNFKK